MNLKTASLLLGLFFYSTAGHSIKLDQVAPDFKLKAEDGKEYSLNDYKGNTIVLEWLNHGCPFVKKHYQSGNMQKTQRFAKAKGVTWLSIVSSAPGKQGHVDSAGALTDKIANNSTADHVLLDPEGTVGKTYKARTTPYMVIINKSGKIAYHGAIDSIASADKEDVPKAENYVKLALSSILEGKKVTKPKTDSYGCGVKY